MTSNHSPYQWYNPAEAARAVDVDVEDSSATLDQLGLDADAFLKSGRQTGGLREILSTRAISDR